VKAVGTSNSVAFALLYMKITHMQAAPSNGYTPMQKHNKTLKTAINNKTITTNTNRWAITTSKQATTNNINTRKCIFPVQQQAVKKNILLTVWAHITDNRKDKENTVEPGYNDIGLSDTSYITSDILWYQLIPHC
jgi:hypothetical protein